MLIAITGATGFIGSALCKHLIQSGHSVLGISRSERSDIQWDLESGEIEGNKLSGVDAVIHLAGENIASRRWSEHQKKRILDSRVRGTELICKAISELSKPPQVLLSGSALGIYGNRGDEKLDESSSHGSGFLADVVSKWEEATQAAEAAGIRVVHLRTGLVQSPSNGMLKKMLPIFRLGLGGKLGGGNQFWSWISLEDEIRLIEWLLSAEISGPVNLTAPRPVTNSEFTRILGKALRRPTFFPVPDFGPRLILGKELASELIHNSLRVLPQRAINAGFEFKHVDLEDSMLDILRH